LLDCEDTITVVASASVWKIIAIYDSDDRMIEPHHRDSFGQLTGLFWVQRRG
jgi:hypothetical protein